MVVFASSHVKLLFCFKLDYFSKMMHRPSRMLIERLRTDN